MLNKFANIRSFAKAQLDEILTQSPFYGPDCLDLESTILKITGKISLVIWSLLFGKVVDF